MVVISDLIYLRAYGSSFFFFFILEGVFKKCTSSETGALDQTVGISLYFRPVLSCGLVNVSVLDNDRNDY